MSFSEEKHIPVACKRCGKKFFPKVVQNVFCSPECRIAAQTERKYWKVSNARRSTKNAAKKRSNQMLISDIAKEARAHGMSYGQYVAMMEQQR